VNKSGSLHVWTCRDEGEVCMLGSLEHGCVWLCSQAIDAAHARTAIACRQNTSLAWKRQGCLVNSYALQQALVGGRTAGVGTQQAVGGCQQALSNQRQATLARTLRPPDRSVIAWQDMQQVAEGTSRHFGGSESVCAHLLDQASTARAFFGGHVRQLQCARPATVP
jgi:hypothetical protein